MFIYSVNIKISKSRETEWRKYMRGHIRDVLNTGHFVDFAFRKLSSDVSDDYSYYNIEYYCQDKQDFVAYSANGATALQNEHTEKFKGDFEAYRELYDDIFDEEFAA